MATTSTSTVINGTNGNDVFTSPEAGQYFLSAKYTIYGGAGDDLYYVSTGTNIVEAVNGGQDTVVSMTNYKMPGNVENMYLWSSAAGIGNDLSNYIQGSSSSNFIDGGKGNDTMYGGGGADTFQFDAGSGHDGIFDWNSSDVIRLAGYSQFTSLADVKAAMTQVGNNVMLKLDANDDIELANTTIAAITDANVQLPFNWKGALHLSFDDEFNTISTRVGATASTGIWNTELGSGNPTDSLYDRTLTSNGEREIYVDPLMKGTGSTALGLNPLSLTNGVLSITAAPTPAADKAALYGYDYTSGYLSTRETFAQTYGYFEAKMKLPSGTGSWPAFWLFRKDQVWPPELDIMEAWNDSTAVQTVHTQQTGTHTTASSSTWLADGSDTFHTYGFLWTATTLTWYLDGVAVFSQPTPADMHSPMYMILNNAVSGAVTDPNYSSSLDVDYVRAYSLGDLPAGTGVVSPDASLTAATTVTSNSTASHPYWGAVAGVDDGFNANYYTAHNPDVVAAGMDPLTHYLQYGKKEGRLPYDSGSDAGTPSAGVTIGADGAIPLTTTGTATTTGSTTTGSTTTGSTTTGSTSTGSSTASGTGTASTSTSTTTPAATTTTTATTPTTTTTTSTTATTTAATTTAATTTATSTAATHAYWGQNDNNADGFNAAFYAAHNPDVVAAGMDLFKHYEIFGKNEGRLPYDPTVTQDTSHSYWGADASQPDGFNAAYYAAHNPDVVLAGMDLLSHYETFGKKEGRLAYDPTVAAASTTTAAGSTSTGTTTAATATGIATTTTTTAATTATTYGKTTATDGFNATYYALHNPDVVAAGMDLLTHFETYGKNEGRLAYDDGTGKESGVGTSANDHFVAPTTRADVVYTGGGGSDTFTFGTHIGWDTITDFDVTNDKLDLSALTAAYGAPTISAIPWESGSMIHFAGSEAILLVGVSVADAQHAVYG